eukprot:COSAG04_NODE_7730_length_1077_cov_1.476483_2_plen_243_part_00
MANKSASSSVPKALPKKRAREEPTGGAVLTAEKNCKLCRSGRGQCRHWNRPGHLQSGLPAPAKAAPTAAQEEEEEDEAESESEARGAAGAAPDDQDAVATGPWSSDEDEQLRRAIASAGGTRAAGSWQRIADAVPGRSSNGCRKRWVKLERQGEEAEDDEEDESPPKKAKRAKRASLSVECTGCDAAGKSERECWHDLVGVSDGDKMELDGGLDFYCDGCRVQYGITDSVAESPLAQPPVSD